ncbi:MAG: hypothetical protein OES24_04445 [Acidimicrobiia bacterium]|nr:hypothetical protein [Acidimicrobiia bacterium]
MFWLYLASAIFGGSFLIPMILGGLGSDMEVDTDLDTDFGTDFDVDTDVDFDTDFELETDFDTDVDLDSDIGSETHSPVSAGLDASQAIVGSLLSFRSIVFFAAFFGAAGLVFTGLGYNVVLTLVTALVLGVVAAVANSVLFGLLKSSESTSQFGERTFEGRPAAVTVPIDTDRRGRIRIDLAGQPHYLVAESFDGEAFKPGHEVVVVEIKDGIARVASLIDLE